LFIVVHDVDVSLDEYAYVAISSASAVFSSNVGNFVSLQFGKLMPFLKIVLRNGIKKASLRK